MHIEPGIVNGAKIVLSYGTLAISLGFLAKASYQELRQQGAFSLLLRSIITSLIVFASFEILPHFPVGVSEVHFIFGTSLLLLFGLLPAAIGLIMGLILQGVLFAPTDLPQLAINLTTLLAPLIAIHFMARRIIPKNTAYVDVSYGQLLQLSLVYQAGITTWVAFWAFYGQGFGAENLAQVGQFGLAYMSVILIEPLVDLALLAIAKHGLSNTTNKLTRDLLQQRLFTANKH